MKKIKLLFVLTAMISIQPITAQVSINTDGSNPASSAMLEVKSETKGMLIPRLTASQRSQISSPATGLMVYQTDGTEGFYFYNGSDWLCLNAGTKPTPDAIADADGDTKVEVEQSAYEDHIHLTTSDTTRMTIDELGKVGIGTTTPTNDLTVYSDTNSRGITLQTSDNSSEQGINFRNSGGHYVWDICRREASPGRADLVFANGNKARVDSLHDRVVFKDGGAVGIGTISPNSSALLDVESTSKGLLPPRMTTSQRDAISNPASGLTIYNTDKNDMEFYNGNYWRRFQLANSEYVVCGEDFIDLRDNKSYSTVQIGTQCWMAENLNVGTRIDGSGSQTNNSTIEKYCYNDNNTNCDTYGGLYQWDEMMGYVTTEGTQGICPTGWHLPTDAEWMTLEEEVESTTGVNWNTTGKRGTDAGGNLKETGTSHWISPNTGATNNSSFTALPGGGRSYSDGSFYNLGYNGHWWSSSENSGVYAWYRYLFYNFAQVDRWATLQTSGFSVRCLKD